MFHFVDRPHRRRFRAVTLIEAVLYVAIALGLIVGGLVLYQQAVLASRTSSTIRQLSAMIAEARVLVKGSGFGTVISETPPFINSNDITSILIAAGAVTPSSVAGTRLLNNPFGGRVWISGFNYSVGSGSTAIRQKVLEIGVSRVPQTACKVDN